jgi:hypothetical protein
MRGKYEFYLPYHKIDIKKEAGDNLPYFYAGSQTL